MGKISVLVPAYNTGEFIGECIESIVKQTYTDLEIIIVDDGSDDETASVANSYAERDYRIKVITTEHHGVSEARNECLGHATGDYILFVDSDDWIASSLCETLYREAKRTSADIVFSTMISVSSDGTKGLFGDRTVAFADTDSLTGPECFIRLVNAGCAYPMVAGNLYRKSIFEEIGIVFKGEYHEDEYSFPSLLKNATRVSYIVELLYYYRQHPKSIMNSRCNFKERAIALFTIANELENALLTNVVSPENNKFIKSLTIHTATLKNKARVLYETYISMSNKHMVVFVVNQSPGLAYGLGTYTRSICYTVNNTPNIDFMGVVLYSNIDVSHFKIEEGCPFYFIPTVRGNKSDYYKSVVYFVASRLLTRRSILFHLNYSSQLPMAIHAKDIIGANILYTQHYMDWGINLGGDKNKLIEKLKDCTSYTTRKFLEEKQMLDECHNIIVTAQHAYETLKEIYNVESKKINLIPHALCPLQNRCDKLLLRNKYSLSENDRIVLYIGRLDDNKNIQCLLKAFSKINYPNVYLWIVGEGHLSIYLNEIDVSDWKRVCFWGYRKPSVISEMYSIATFGVVPSKYEEFGYVALEMLMNGLPVILNNTTGLSEFTKFESVLTFDGTEKSLIDAINHALHNLPIIKNKGLQQKVKQYFSYSRFKSNMLGIYNNRMLTKPYDNEEMP